MAESIDPILSKLLEAVSPWPKITDFERRLTTIEAGFKNFEGIPAQIVAMSKDVAVLVANATRMEISVRDIEQNTRKSDQTLNQASGAAQFFKTVFPWILSAAALGFAFWKKG